MIVPGAGGAGTKSESRRNRDPSFLGQRTAAAAAEYEAHDDQDGGDYEEDLRKISRKSGDAAEAEERRDQCDDREK